MSMAPAFISVTTSLAYSPLGRVPQNKRWKIWSGHFEAVEWPQVLCTVVRPDH